MKKDEIGKNWDKYKNDPFFMFAAPLFKPDNDPRSRLQFAKDNWTDVITTGITNVFRLILEPVFKIFGVLFTSLSETANGLFNIKALFANMYNRFGEMIDIFMRRFYNVFHQFHLTFVKLFHAIQKTYAVAISAVYEGLSTVHTIASFVDLMIKIIIVILIVLVILTIFFWFILAPFSGLLISVVAIIASTAFAGSVGGMSDTFCFAANTNVCTTRGIIPINHIRIGDHLTNGATVFGTMQFKNIAEDLYELYGVTVSSSHVVYAEDGSAMHVHMHPGAKKVEPRETELYCLITSTRTIPIETNRGCILFADWEELESTEDLQRWNAQVYETLNASQVSQLSDENALHTEAAVSEHSIVMTMRGPKEIRHIVPGEFVMDMDGTFTEVMGVVKLHGSQVHHAYEIAYNQFVSAGAWIYCSDSATWDHPCVYARNTQEGDWYNLFTESGVFALYKDGTKYGIRDFTDIGPDHIHETYDWVLKSLQKAQ